MLPVWRHRADWILGMVGVGIVTGVANGFRLSQRTLLNETGVNEPQSILQHAQTKTVGAPFIGNTADSSLLEVDDKPGTVKGSDWNAIFSNDRVPLVIATSGETLFDVIDMNCNEECDCSEPNNFIDPLYLAVTKVDSVGLSQLQAPEHAAPAGFYLPYQNISSLEKRRRRRSSSGLRNFYVSPSMEESKRSYCFFCQEDPIANPGAAQDCFQQCPTGFFCPGGIHQPVVCHTGTYCPRGSSSEKPCPKGSMCPVPSKAPLPCPKWGHCPERSHLPGLCPAGKFCDKGKEYTCPGGYYCPHALTVKVPCKWYSSCPRGTASPGNLLFFSLASVLVAFSVALVVAARRNHSSNEYRILFVKLLARLTILLLLALLVLYSSMVGFYAMSIALCLIVWAVGRFLGRTFMKPMAAVGAVFLLLFTGFYSNWWNVAFLVLAFTPFVHIPVKVRGAFCSIMCFVVLLRADPLVAVVFLVIVSGLIGSELYAHKYTEPGLKLLSRNPDTDDSVTFLATSFPSRVPTQPDDNFERSPKDRRMSMASTSISLELCHCNFVVPGGLTVLQDISLRLLRGRSVAIMGPSGCGKSSLLNVLSGNDSYGYLEAAAYGDGNGILLINGQATTPIKDLGPCVGYVPQDDVLFRGLTVRENIQYFSRQRKETDDYKQNIDQVMQKMQMTEVMDSIIGDEFTKGISGGQRKRVSIALDLVHPDLKVLFLDEPTSGLDSSTSHSVMENTLQQAKDMHCTVAAVIHQPRFSTLSLFDIVVLLAPGGLLIYAGPVSKARAYFEEQLGVHFPPDTNPADTFLDVLTRTECNEEVHLQWAEAWKQYALKEDNQQGVGSKAALGSALRSAEDCPPWITQALISVDCTSLLMSRQALAITGMLVFFGIMTTSVCFAFRSDDEPNSVMQLISFQMLLFMLFVGLRAQQYFGADTAKVEERLASIGGHIDARFYGKDLVATLELAMWSLLWVLLLMSFGGLQTSFSYLLMNALGLAYSTFGLNYVIATFFAPQITGIMCIVAVFASIQLCGQNIPSLVESANLFAGRGWVLSDLSPLRWYWTFAVTYEVQEWAPAMKKAVSAVLTPVKGFNMCYLSQQAADQMDMINGNSRCERRLAKMTSMDFIPDMVKNGIAWQHHTHQAILLGIIFRVSALAILMIKHQVHQQGWLSIGKPFFLTGKLPTWAMECRILALLVLGCMYVYAMVWVMDHTSFIVTIAELLGDTYEVKPWQDVTEDNVYAPYN